MVREKRILTVVKVTAVSLIILSLGVVTYVSVSSSYFSGFSFNPYSTASYNTTGYAPQGNYSLYITASNCRVEVLPSTDSYLRGTLEVSNNFFQKAFANIEVTEIANTFNFEIITPKSIGTTATAFIYLPGNLPVKAVSAVTENGNINVDLPVDTGSVVMESTNGNLNLEGGALGNTTMQTTNGNVYLSSSSFIQLVLNTVNGNIETHFPSHISSGSASLSTTNGNLNFYVNKTSNLTISASTVNGIVSVSGLTYTATQSTLRQFLGTVNSGGVVVNLAAVNGNVKLSGT